MGVVEGGVEGVAVNICLGMQRGAGKEEGNGIAAGGLREKIVTNQSSLEEAGSLKQTDILLHQTDLMETGLCQCSP